MVSVSAVADITNVFIKIKGHDKFQKPKLKWSLWKKPSIIKTPINDYLNTAINYNKCSCIYKLLYVNRVNFSNIDIYISVKSKRQDNI